MEIKIHSKAFVATVISASIILLIVILGFLTQGFFIAVLFIGLLVTGLLSLIYFTAKEVFEEQEYWEKRNKS